MTGAAAKPQPQQVLLVLQPLKLGLLIKSMLSSVGRTIAVKPPQSFCAHALDPRDDQRIPQIPDHAQFIP